MTPEERFWAKVEKTETCWLWTATTNGVGYGQFYLPGHVRIYAHRLAYEWLVGPIPDGLVIDHLCKVTLCVRPDHLEVVTRGENNRRGSATHNLVAKHLSKTTCPNGHPYTPENTRINIKGHRKCRTCERARVDRLRLERQETA